MTGLRRERAGRAQSMGVGERMRAAEGVTVRVERMVDMVGLPSRGSGQIGSGVVRVELDVVEFVAFPPPANLATSWTGLL